MKIGLCFLTAVVAVCAGVALAQMAPMAPLRKSLIENGNFEAPTDKTPPPGWVLWGRQKDKIPENFTLDPDRPHEGKFSMRIHHPAGTHAYLVSDPDKAVRTKKGMAYLVSFWSRTANMDEPGIVYWEAKGASSPGQWPIHPSVQWTLHKYEVHEGVDFFADNAAQIFLAFRPARSQTPEQTLWIDDVVVTQVKTTKTPLVDERKLEYAPLQHRLKPGEKFQMKIDANKRIGPAVPQAGGESFHRLAGYRRHPWNIDTKEYVLEAKLEQAIRDAKLPLTRFYATGVEPWPIEQTLDIMAQFMDKLNIPRQWTIIELETQGADEKLSPEFWARAVAHSKAKGYGFRFWEIANEPYTRKATAFDTPDDYVAHLIACAKAIRAVQDDVQIGIGIHSTAQGWGNYILKQAAGYYDFVVGHYYCPAGTSDFEQVALTANFKMLDHILMINALIDTYNPDRDVYQLDTEWGVTGIGGEGPDAAWRRSNIYAAMHRAVRMIYYAREGMLRGAAGWEMFSRAGEGRKPGLAFLTRDFPDKAFMNYWVYYYFNRHVGKYALDIEGTAPWRYVKPEKFSGPQTPTLVTLDEDGRRMYFVIANASWDDDAPCVVNLANFIPAAAAAVVLTQQDRDAPGLVDSVRDVTRDLPVQLSGDKLSFTVPAHSVVFITVDAK